MALMRRLRIIDSHEELKPMNPRLKVAFATDDLKQVNQHFGSARSFAIHAVDLDGHELFEVAEFGKLDQDGNEDKLAVKIQLLEGCARSTAGPWAPRRSARSWRPVSSRSRSRHGSLIEELLEDLGKDYVPDPRPGWPKITRQTPLTAASSSKWMPKAGPNRRPTRSNPGIFYPRSEEHAWKLKNRSCWTTNPN
jgi:nitrogen fixation protein NifX